MLPNHFCFEITIITIVTIILYIPKEHESAAVVKNIKIAVANKTIKYLKEITKKTLSLLK